jgi:hypothetical protein
MKFAIKRVLALSIDLGIIMAVSFLFVQISHNLFKIQSKDLDSFTRSLVSTGYLLACLYFLNFRTLGMRLNSLSFERIQSNSNPDIGILRILFFYLILGFFITLMIMGLFLISQMKRSPVGYILLLASGLNFIPRKHLIHEKLSGLMISDDTRS